ncbi:hypothetical protein D3C81_1742790 [compost metagenome]
MVQLNFLCDHGFGFNDFFSLFLHDNIPYIAAGFFFGRCKINMAAFFLNVSRELLQIIIQVLQGMLADLLACGPPLLPISKCGGGGEAPGLETILC